MWRNQNFIGQMFAGQLWGRARNVPAAGGTWVRVPRDAEVWIRVPRQS